MLFATLLALAAAALHAAWNLLLKTAPPADRDLASWGMFLVAGALTLPVAVALGGPGLVSVPWLAISGVVHVAYITFLVAAYRHGDFSLAYPLARGGGALLGAIGGAAFLGDHLSAWSWLAIAVVAGALLSLVGRGASAPTVRDALVTAAAIGSYTLVDSHGARVSTNAVAYGTAGTAIAAVGLSVVLAARGRAGALALAWPVHRGRWLVAGTASSVAYTLVLVAVQHAPVGYVAVLRESSVVLGALAGWKLLREPLGRRRLIASLVILAGMTGLIVSTL